MARTESPDRRPLLYGFAAVLILIAAGFIFWPRGDGSHEPGMVLTPDNEQGQLAAQIESPGEELSTAQDPAPADSGQDVAPEEIRSQPINETEYAVEAQPSSQTSGASSSGSQTQSRPTTDRAVTGSGSSQAQATQAPATQTTPRATDLSQPGASGRYLLYVGSFSTRANADRKAKELQGKGVPAEVSSGTKADGTAFYRVRVGYFEGHSRAKSYGDNLKSRLGLDYWIAER